MKTAPADLRGAGPFVEASPGEIRAALAGEEAGRFDSEWREILARAMETRDLSEVFAMLDRWRRVAWSAREDAQAHQRMLENAARLLAGGDIPTEPWHVTKARLGL